MKRLHLVASLVLATGIVNMSRAESCVILGKKSPAYAPPIVQASGQKGCLSTVQQLIKEKTNLNARSPYPPEHKHDRTNRKLVKNRKRTPLMIASAQGNTEIVKELIKAGANINLTDMDNNTALDLAANDEIKKLLEEKGGKTGASVMNYKSDGKLLPGR